MNEQHDAEMSRRLAELETPAHGPGFWTALRTELDASTAPRGSEDETVPSDELAVELDERRARRTPTRGLVAAAVLLVALAVGTALVSTGEDDRTAVATDPTVGDDPTPTTRPEEGSSRLLRPVGDAVDRSAGRVVGIDPTTGFVYVTDVAPGDGSGCEGAPREALYVEPAEGGRRELVLSVEMLDATGGLDMRFGPNREVVVVPRCEGFGSRLVTGRIAGDGRIIDSNELGITDQDLGRPVDRIVDLEFISESMLAVVTYAVGDDGTERRHVYALPTTPSEATDLELDGTVAIDVTPEGELVTADIDGVIRVDGRLVGGAPHAVVDLAVTDDGTHVVVLGPDQLTAWPIGGGEAWGVELESPSQIHPVGGRAVAVAEHIGVDGAVRISVLDPVTGERATLLELGVPGRGFVVTADDRRLLANGAVESHDVVVEQPLTR